MVVILTQHPQKIRNEALVFLPKRNAPHLSQNETCHLKGFLICSAICYDVIQKTCDRSQCCYLRNHDPALVMKVPIRCGLGCVNKYTTSTASSHNCLIISQLLPNRHYIVWYDQIWTPYDTLRDSATTSPSSVVLLKITLLTDFFSSGSANWLAGENELLGTWDSDHSRESLSASRSEHDTWHRTYPSFSEPSKRMLCFIRQCGSGMGD